MVHFGFRLLWASISGFLLLIYTYYINLWSSSPAHHLPLSSSSLFKVLVLFGVSTPCLHLSLASLPSLSRASSTSLPPVPLPLWFIFRRYSTHPPQHTSIPASLPYLCPLQPYRFCFILGFSSTNSHLHTPLLLVSHPLYLFPSSPTQLPYHTPSDMHALPLPHLSSPGNIQLRVASLPTSVLFPPSHFSFLRISFHLSTPTRTSAPFLAPSLPLPFTSYTPSVSHLFPSYTLSLSLCLSPRLTTPALSLSQTSGQHPHGCPHASLNHSLFHSKRHVYQLIYMRGKDG